MEQSWCENILLQPLGLNKKDSQTSWVYVQHNFTSAQQKLIFKKLKHRQNKSLFLKFESSKLYAIGFCINFVVTYLYNLYRQDYPVKNLYFK